MEDDEDEGGAGGGGDVHGDAGPAVVGERVVVLFRGVVGGGVEHGAGVGEGVFGPEGPFGVEDFAGGRGGGGCRRRRRCGHGGGGRARGCGVHRGQGGEGVVWGGRWSRGKGKEERGRRERWRAMGDDGSPLVVSVACRPSRTIALLNFFTHERSSSPHLSSPLALAFVPDALRSPFVSSSRPSASPCIPPPTPPPPATASERQTVRGGSVPLSIVSRKSTMISSSSPRTSSSARNCPCARHKLKRR